MLGPNQLSDYRQEGVVFPLQVLSRSEASKYRDHCDDLENLLGGHPRTIEVRQMHFHFEWAFDLATQPRILAAASSVLGPDIVVWATELFTKHPEDQNTSIGWHRDAPYMGFENTDSVTAWLALSPCNYANGCLCAVSRSRSSLVLAPGQTRAKEPEPSVDDMLQVELQRGQLSLHAADILHGSAPNISKVKRVGFAIRYIRSSARPVSGKPKVILAQGESHHDLFEFVERPRVWKSLDSAREDMRQSAEAHLQLILANLAANKVAN